MKTGLMVMCGRRESLLFFIIQALESFLLDQEKLGLQGVSQDFCSAISKGILKTIKISRGYKKDRQPQD